MMKQVYSRVKVTTIRWYLWTGANILSRKGFRYAKLHMKIAIAMRPRKLLFLYTK